MLLTFQDRLRIPWRGGAKQVTVDNVLPVVLLVSLQLLAALDLYCSLVIFSLIPLLLAYLKRFLGRVLPKTKFFSLWLFWSGIYLVVLFESTVPLLELLPEENIAFVALMTLSFFCFYKANVRAALNHINQAQQQYKDDPSLGNGDSQTAILISDREDSDESDGRLACQTCRKYVPPRTYHCKVCATCVIKQDQHSVWLNCCIGRANHRFFLCGCVSSLLALWLFANLSLTSVCHPTPIFTLFGITVMLPDDCTDIYFQYEHEMIKRKPKTTRHKPPPDPVRAYQQEVLDNHKRAIESTLFENELNKFRKEVSKNGANVKKNHVSEQKKSFLFIDLPKIDNSFIYESLEECEKFTNDFYESAIRGTDNFIEELRQEKLMTFKEPATIEEIREETDALQRKYLERSNGDDANDEEPTGDSVAEEEEEENKIVRFGDTQVITYPAEESSFSLDGSDYDFDDNELFLESLDSDLDEFDDAEFLSTESASEQTQDEPVQNTFNADSSDDCFIVTRIEDSGGSSKDDSVDFGKEKLTYNYDDPEVVEEPIIPLEEGDLIMVKRCEMEEKDYSKLRVTNYRPGETLSNDDKIEISEESRKVISAALKEGFMQNYDRALLKQYFFKWLQFTILEKISKGAGVTSTREQKLKRINDFINNIRANKKKTAKPNATVTQVTTVKKDYEHRLKVQQDIIELQKLKLERQERIITELKLSKFSEAAKISKMEIQSELHKAMRTGHVRLRAKAKCIQIVGNMKNDTSEEDEMRKLQAQGLMIPKFLAKMQERAMERSQRHMEAKERRMRLEKEREESKMAAEEAKRLEDEEARKRRYREMREKRKLEKLQKIIREQERQAWIANNQIAKEFRLLKLKRLGILAFKLLLGIRRDNERRAMVARKRFYKKKYFRRWWNLTNSVWEGKKQMADELANRKLMRHGMNGWKEYCHEQRKKMQVAMDWWEVRQTEKVISVWIGRTKQSLLILQGKMSHAAAHYEWQLKWKVFERWQRLHIILKIEKETEQRRQRWRMKIWELLPDYKPIEEEI